MKCSKNRLLLAAAMLCLAAVAVWGLRSRDVRWTSIAEPGYVQYEYISKELPDLFAAADIILSRAGANAIFEFLALAKPALLIPLPLSASRGDQILNAGYFARKGYAMTLDQANLTPDTLFDSIHDLYDRRLSFISAMSGDATADGTDEVLDVIRSESEGSKR